eukprot:365625-Chlamydomonas_euryale.AAC.1
MEAMQAVYYTNPTGMYHHHAHVLWKATGWLRAAPNEAHASANTGAHAAIPPLALPTPLCAPSTA